jgi:UPF0755 protein
VKRRLTSLLALVIFAAGVGGVWFWIAAFHDRAYPAGETVAVVPRGATASEVAALLGRAGVIGSPWVFRVLARWHGAGASVQAGEYRFAPHQTTAQILHQVTTGGKQVAVWVTIPEGFTAREIAATLAQRGVGEAPAFESYFRDTSLELDGTKTASLEGYLFPDTYLIPVGATPADAARPMLERFREVLPKDAAARAKKLGLTVPQVVTLASLIEREAKADDERRLMAGVYYNRLRIGMPLQVDATIEYTFAHHKDVITLADLARDSPYNTYENAGLPPTPIANPGKPSLLAAFDPEPSQFLYYVYMGNGHHAFSRTLAEHDANVARYLR